MIRLLRAALTAAYRRHNRRLTERAHDFDAHVGEALAVAAWDDHGYHDAAEVRDETTPEYQALMAHFARIDAAVADFAAEVEALADSELQELIEGDRP